MSGTRWASALTRVSAAPKERDVRALSSRAAPISSPSRHRRLDRGSEPTGHRFGAAEVAQHDRPARGQRRVVAGREHQPGFHVAALDRPFQARRARVAVQREVLLGAEHRRETRRQRPARRVDPNLRLRAAEGGAEQQDDQHRQHEQKEQVRALAHQPPQVQRRDRDRLHALSSLSARSSVSSPQPRAIPSITAAGPIAALTDAPPVISRSPRRNHACGVNRLSVSIAPPAW